MSTEWRERGFVQDSDEEDWGSVESQRKDENTLIYETSELQKDDQTQRASIQNPEAQTADLDELAGDHQTSRLELETKQPDAHDGSKSPSRLLKTPLRSRFGRSESDDDELDELQLDLDVAENPLQSLQGIESRNQSHASQPSGQDILDITSSPLTEPPEDLSPPDSFGLIAPIPASDQQRASHNVLTDAWTPEAPRGTLDIAEGNYFSSIANTGMRSRSFRKRNPIQLHPYLLENEQYRQTLRSRGLKPIALRPDHADGLTENVDFESQDRDNLGFQQSQSSEFQDQGSSKASSRQHSPITEARAHRTRIIMDADDFPQLKGLIARNENDVERLGFKRRKIAHSNLSLPMADSHQEVRVMVPSPITPHERADVFEFPNDEASHEKLEVATTQTRRKRRIKKFRFPKGLQNGNLPTPAASSDTGRLNMNSIDFDSESDVELSRPHQPPRALSVSSGSEVPIENRSRLLEPPTSASSSESEVDQMKKVRRKIKGVLPASWLRLDRKAQPNLQGPEQQGHTRSNSSPRKLGQRGVAQKVHKHHTGSNGIRLPLSITGVSPDDSDDGLIQSPKNLSRGAHDSIPPSPRIQANLSFDADTQDIPEDNSIDAMIPAQTRAKRHSTGRKRQTRLTHVFTRDMDEGLKKPESPLNEATSIKYHHRHHPHTGASKRRGSKRPKWKSLPTLSILDVVDDISPNLQPDFIRLACRQARQDINKSRQRPAGKILSLHNWDDQAEVDSYIRHWREGRIQTARDDVQLNYSERKPLSERSQNYINPSKDSAKQTRLTSSLLERIARPSINSPEHSTARLKQSRLNQVFLDERSDKTASPRNSEPSKQKPILQIRKTGHTSDNWRRPGQLEDLQSEDDQEYHASAFRRDLLALNDRFANERGHKRTPANPLLDRFLIEDDDAKLNNEEELSQVQPVPSRTNPVPPKTRRRRKNAPHQILPNQDIRYRVVGGESSQDHRPLDSSESRKLENHQSTIVGLAPYGTRYPTDFDIRALPFGMFFNSATLIGSGELTDALRIPKRNLLEPIGLMNVICGSQSYQWGPWTEEVSFQLQSVLGNIHESMKTMNPASEVSSSSKNIDTYETLRAVVKYYAKFLSFYDPIDAASCVAQSQEALERLLNSFEEQSSRLVDTWKSWQWSEWLGCLALLSVIACELHQISEHCEVTKTLGCEPIQFLRKTAKLIISHVLETRMDDVRSVLSSMDCSQVLERGIGNESRPIEGLVVLRHITESIDDSELQFWSIINEYFSKKPLNTTMDIRQFEKVWHDIFTLLPLIQFDSAGILLQNPTFQSSVESWSTIKAVLNRLFELYSRNLDVHSSTVNAYIRTTLNRCFVLLNNWKWYKSEPILNCVFDFFAHNGLSLLQFEENRGTVLFLERLDEADPPTIKADDRSFDIFLKLLATGLIAMREVYSYKKIRNIAWRFIPNHGRSHDKEHDLRKEDLDALKNHHNILCVLYYASPPSFRPSLNLVRRLVDFKSSHSEACRLNVRSWSNLTRFFLSQSEPDTLLEDFCAWYNEMLLQLISQHQYARTEAEMLIAATSSDINPVQRDSIEPIIASNQQQVEGVLSTLLGSFQELLASTKNISSAVGLFEGTQTAEVFKMFDNNQKRTNALLILALDVYQSYGSLLNRKPSAINTVQQDSEESQDYGEWPNIEDVDGIDQSTSDLAGEKNEKTFRELHSVLSNVFGADNFYDEALLAKVADTWVMLCHRRVKIGKQAWSHYIDQHGSDSWFQLRNTDSTRKFMPYVFSKILGLDNENFYDCEESYISAWLVSLMDRESMLKYQHILTSTLLNAASSSAIFQNLPFAQDLRTGLFNIKLEELRARRLSVISQVLLNIRNSVEDAFLRNSPILSELRNHFASILKKTMNAMKKNFQETQQSSAVRGNYVEFVQQVVEYLQQYTSDICPVDKFFTDSAAFPLPANDPTYVVARLKGYGLRLSDERNQKKLAVFVQAVCERAIIDNQQGYLIDQFKKAVDGEFYSGDASSVNLRQFLLQGIFPSYLFAAIETDCGWIFAIPILEATEYMIQNLLFSFNMVSVDAAKSVANMVRSVLETLQHICEGLALRPELFSESHVIVMLSLIANTTAASLSIVDYIHRAFSSIISVDSGMDAIEYVTEFLDSVAASGHTSSSSGHLQDGPFARISSSPSSLSLGHVGQYTDSNLSAVRAFCTQELRETLTKAWRRRCTASPRISTITTTTTTTTTTDDVAKDKYAYSVLRGISSRDVTVHVKPTAEARADLVDAVAKLVHGVEAMPCFA